MLRLFVTAVAIVAGVTGILYLLGQAAHKQATAQRPAPSAAEQQEAQQQTITSLDERVAITPEQITNPGTERQAILSDEAGRSVGRVDVESRGDELRVLVEMVEADDGAAVTAAAGSCADRRGADPLPGVSESATALDLKPMADGLSRSRVQIRESLIQPGIFALAVHETDSDSAIMACAEIHVVAD